MCIRDRIHEANYPVLVGTVSVEVSETLARMLKRRGIRHSVLNAKYHKQEAEIVSRAGEPGMVTIATNWPAGVRTSSWVRASSAFMMRNWNT